MTIDPTEFEPDEPRKRVGVIAAADLQLGSDGERTLATLESIFPVRFERTNSPDPSGFDGVLALGAEWVAEVPAGLPRLVLPVSSPASDRAAGAVLLAGESAIPRPLRGQVIPEGAPDGEVQPALAGATQPAHPGGLPPAAAGATVLASVAGRPVWWRIPDATTAVDISAYPLAALGEGEALRDHLRVGRFMGLLPLVCFLHRLLGGEAWRLPPLRASFVVDDPNLHWPSYGFLNYRELAAHAVRHGYHVGFATVPLDGWLVERRAAALFAQNASTLSLVMHGNDHVARELGRLSTDAEAGPPIAQALRRVAAMERRHGVSVERVMVPPFEACSEAALRTMFRLGIDAACHTLPYPWRDPRHATTALAGWHSAELVAGGLPVLLRYPLDAPREDLALRALLGQPLILYGHHKDFAQGLDILAQAAAEINALGDVRWGPLGWIARGNYAARQVGETLLVRAHARRIVLDVPAGVRTLRLVVPEPLGGAAGHRVVHAGAAVEIAFAEGWGASRPLAVDAPARIELVLPADRPLSTAELPSRGVKPWPLLRRVLVEGRDRVEALR